MADQAKTENAMDEELVVPKRSPLVPLLLVVNLLGLGGAAVYFLFLRGDKPAKADTAAAAPAPAPAPLPAAAGDGSLGELPPITGGGNGPLLALDNFIVNLADEEVNRYLKVGLTLELGSEEASEALKKKEPVVRDAIITLTSSLTFADIRTPKGKRQLRAQLLRVVNGVLGAPLVRAVFFNEFVVQ